MLVDVVAERLVEQAVELAEVAEDDVAALVPGEAGGIDDATTACPPATEARS